MEIPSTREETKLPDLDLDVHAPYKTAVDQVRAALREQGFGVLTEIDVQATMKDKLDADFRPYVILGACNPALAYRALSEDLAIGLMLPCNVIVYEIEAEKSRVQFMDPVAALALSQNEQVTPIAHEAKDRLKKVSDTLRETDERARGAL